MVTTVLELYDQTASFGRHCCVIVCVRESMCVCLCECVREGEYVCMSVWMCVCEGEYVRMPV